MWRWTAAARDFLYASVVLYSSDVFCSSHTQLGHLNTPITEWRVPGLPQDFTVSIKRDDMTGSVLSGNKACYCTSSWLVHMQWPCYWPLMILADLWCEACDIYHSLLVQVGPVWYSIFSYLLGVHLSQFSDHVLRPFWLFSHNCVTL